MTKWMFGSMLMLAVAVTGSAWAATAAPYPLTTCPVTGGPLGSMGDPITKVIDGREVRFCCGGCPAKFEAKRADYFKKMDEEIVKQQKPLYPVQTCVVSGDKLGGHGEPIAYVRDNRLFLLCCDGCKKEIDQDTAKYSAELDKAAAEQQKKTYPIDTCVVSDKKFAAQGAAASVVFGGRLVQFCSQECVREFEKNPSKYLKKLDAAKK